MTVAKIGEAADQTDIDHRAAALPDHVRQDHLAGDERAGEVEIDLVAELIDRHLDRSPGERTHIGVGRPSA